MLLYLDLDDFKEINDRHGHRAGDHMLVAVASRLSELVRSADTVARLGGDEFVILAEELENPDDAARSLAERIHVAMREPVMMGERDLRTSVSIGIAPILSGADPEASLARADAAMYEAKRRGHDRYVMFTDTIGAEVRRRSRLTDELRVAQRLHQFVIDYRPASTPKGDRNGVEAVLRWEHPELGDVAPAEFVPLLEQSRDIVDVGRWVLAEACAQCRRWQDEGRAGLSVAVGVSRRQLMDPEFHDDVLEALIGAGLDPGSLVLEFPEQALVAESPTMVAVMDELRHLGVHLVIDDTGAGEHSLLHLRDLALDRLNMDHAVIRGSAIATPDAALVGAVMEMAQRIGLRVVADGAQPTAGEPGG